MRAARKMESGPPESCKTMKNRGMIPENNHKIRPKGRILFCDCLTQYAGRKPAIGRAVSARLIARRIYQARIGTGTAGRAVLLDFRQAKPIRLEFAPGQARYAERKLATGRAVSARLIARRIYQARIGTGTAGRAVLLDFRQAKTIRLEFAPGQSRYAEREPATSRVGPMVLFDHRPTRTNWPPALPGKNPPFPEKRGIFHTNCSTQYAEREPATGREVLLDFRQATSTSHEFGRRPRPT